MGNNSGNKWLFATDYCCKWILACNSPCVDLQHYNSTPQTKISVVKSFDSTTDMAQMVGVEPTRQSPVLKHFECSLLRPLEYICIFNFVARNFPQGVISSAPSYDHLSTSACVLYRTHTGILIVLYQLPARLSIIRQGFLPFLPFIRFR